METHVCVLQTALDLITAGYDVFLAVDASAARHPLDHETALRRLEVERRDSDHDRKRVVRVVRSRGHRRVQADQPDRQGVTMRVAVTGATGFVGRQVVAQLLDAGHTCRCWYRPTSDREGYPAGPQLEWVPGQLNDEDASRELVRGCQAVIHAALDRPGDGFRGAEGDVVGFAERNVVGSLRLIEAARQADVERFVFISTCAVHDRILDDRPLDEAHPLWSLTHYGATKRPSSSSCTVTDSARVSRSALCVRRGSTASTGR